MVINKDSKHNIGNREGCHVSLRMVSSPFSSMCFLLSVVQYSQEAEDAQHDHMFTVRSSTVSFLLQEAVSKFESPKVSWERQRP